MSFFPIRCFTCSKPISQLWEKFKEERDSIPDEVEDKTTAIKKILNGYGIGRICCMRMFMTHTDIEHIQCLYPVHKDNIERLGNPDKKPRPQNYTFKSDRDEDDVSDNEESDIDVEDENGDSDEE